MRKLSLKLPETLYKQLEALARAEGVPIDQFINTAIAEKLLALTTQNRFEAPEGYQLPRSLGLAEDAGVSAVDSEGWLQGRWSEG